MPTAAAAGTDRPPGCRGRALPGGLRRSAVAVAVAATAVLVLSWAPGVAGAGTPALADPAASISPHPDYLDLCAPAGIDTSTTCLRITLAAIDHARAKEHLGPMRLPASFPHLSVAEQLFVAVDAERVDRGLAPFAGLSAVARRRRAAGCEQGAAPEGSGLLLPTVRRRVDRRDRERTRRRLRLGLRRRPERRRAGLRRPPALGVLGGPGHRARPAGRRHRPRDGRRPRPGRRPLPRSAGWPVAGGDVRGGPPPSPDLRLHLGRGSGRDRRGHAVAARLHPSRRVGHGIADPPDNVRAHPTTRVLRAERARRLGALQRRRAGGDQPRQSARGSPADGAPDELRGSSACPTSCSW